MTTIQTLAHFAEGYELFAYALLFIGVVIEGELVMIFGGILAQLGALSMPVVLGVSFAAAIVKTLVWYGLGSFIRRRYAENTLLKYLERRVLYLFPHFNEKPFWSIVISNWPYMAYFGF